MIRSLLLSLFLISPVLAGPPPYPFPLDADGWSMVPIAPGAHQYFISNSTGSDTNTGTQTAPFKTIAHAMSVTKAGNCDWILLKCGDTFPEMINGVLSGSGKNYAVITSYGTGERPVVGGSVMAGKSLVLLYGANIAVIDVEFNGGRDPSLPGWKLVATGGGVQFRGANLLFEGNKSVWNCGSNLDVEPNPNQPALPGVVIRRNVIAFAYSGGVSFSQGIHTDGLISPFIEENFVHQNGWNPKVALGTNSMFNHGIYCSWNFGATSSYMRWNIFSNNCSSGVQQRCGGVFSNNLLLNNGTAEDWTGEGDSCDVENNVSTSSKDCPLTIGPGSQTFYTGGGFQFNAIAGTMSNNIVAHQGATAIFSAYQLSRNPGDKSDPTKEGSIEIANNVTYDTYWDAYDYVDTEHPIVSFHNNVTQLCRRKATNFRPSAASGQKLIGKFTLSNNTYDKDGQFWWQNVGMNLVGWEKNVTSTGESITAPKFVDATKTIESYIVWQKLGTNYQDFVTVALQQRKGHYNKMLVAYSPNAWFQQGFALVPPVVVPPVVVPPVVVPPVVVPPVAAKPVSIKVEALSASVTTGGIKPVPLTTEKLGPATALGYTLDGSTARFNKIDLTGVTGFEATLACDNTYAGRLMQVHLDSATGVLIASIKVAGTGTGWYTYKSQSSAITGKPTGVHDVYLLFSAPGDKQGVANVLDFTIIK